MNKIKVVSVNISEQKGTIKTPVDEIKLNRSGIVNDAHAGMWHRQVSLLGIESISKMEPAAGRKLGYGEFAENITTRGFPLYNMRPFDLLIHRDTVLEITQIGKICHGRNCAIFRQTGDCVMPKEGIFCRVVSGGVLKAGDEFIYKPKVMNVQIITLSDRASIGEYEDKSGPRIRELVGKFFAEAGHKVEFGIAIIPDEAKLLEASIRKHVEESADIIFTTGGTGIGPRDISPDVIRPMLDKETPGIMDMIRIKYGMQFPNALISRSLSGLIGKSLVYVLPGSPKAAGEYTTEILKSLEHSLLMVHGIDKHQ